MKTKYFVSLIVFESDDKAEAEAFIDKIDNPKVGVVLSEINLEE